MSAQPPFSATASALGFGDSTIRNSTYQSTHPVVTSNTSNISNTSNTSYNQSYTQPNNPANMPTQGPSTPLFTATSTSVRHISSLLSTIRFASQCQVTILPDGINFSTEEARVMQATVFLDKGLFASYNYNSAVDVTDPSSPIDHPCFAISLPALVETLNIFGASDSSNKFGANPDRDEYASNIRPHRISAFSNITLGMTGICRFSYAGEGEAFKIILEESGVTTTCELVTYEAEGMEEIPFEKAHLEAKIILQSRYLWDAIQEISAMTAMSSGPGSRLKVVSSERLPYFSLSAAGELGSAAVEFGKSKELLETFQVRGRWVQYYKFDFIKQAVEAMKLASKVSLRGDRQGVLSLQFMIEAEGSSIGGGTGTMSFVDFRFVPCVQEGEDEDDATDDDGDYEGGRDEAEGSAVGDDEL